MRIAFFGINYWPDETGIAPFTTGRCEYLAARGHEVTVFTGFPYYPAWRVPESYRRRLFGRESRRGVTILRSWMYVPHRVSSSRRILHEASFTASACVRALGQGRGKRPELLFVVSPPLALGLAAVALSSVWKIPYVLHVADLQPDAAVDLGMLRNGRLTRLLYAIERTAYRDAALITTLTGAMRERIVNKGIAPAKVVLSSDWARPSLFELPAAGGGADFRRSLGIDSEFIAVHAGNMGVKQGLDVVLDAAERSREDLRLLYLLVGDGAVRERLEQRAKATALRNVRFLPLQPEDRFADMLAAADACLVTQQRSVADIVFPSKVITLMSAARPVVASLSPGSEVARVLRDAECGLVVAPEDPRSLLEALLTLRADRARCNALGANGRAYARKQWEKEGVLSALERHLLDVIQRPRTDPTTPKHPFPTNGKSEES